MSAGICILIHQLQAVKTIVLHPMYHWTSAVPIISSPNYDNDSVDRMRKQQQRYMPKWNDRPDDEVMHDHKLEPSSDPVTPEEMLTIKLI